ncbi:hypothetical protein HYS54_03665 [Candidatus Micrarchaeota archaeon]|nr:hypothetical protein [Candidatus Micrarchaeota archaeon]
MAREFTDLLAFDEQAAAMELMWGWKRVLVAGKEANVLRTARDQPMHGKVNIVVGGQVGINNAAARDKRIHVLLDPTTAAELAFDTATATMMRENNVALGFSLAAFLARNARERSRLVANARMCIAIALKAGVEVVLASGAGKPVDAQDLASFGTLIGLEKPKSLWAVSDAPASICEKAGLFRYAEEAKASSSSIAKRALG